MLDAKGVGGGTTVIVLILSGLNYRHIAVTAGQLGRDALEMGDDGQDDDDDDEGGAVWYMCTCYCHNNITSR